MSPGLKKKWTNQGSKKKILEGPNPEEIKMGVIELGTQLEEALKLKEGVPLKENAEYKQLIANQLRMTNLKKNNEQKKARLAFLKEEIAKKSKLVETHEKAGKKKVIQDNSELYQSHKEAKRTLDKTNQKIAENSKTKLPSHFSLSIGNSQETHKSR